VLRDYLTVTRNLDPTALEQSRMAQLEQGYERPTLDPLRGLAYVALQEVATRAAHRNTGRYSDDPVADRIMVRISTDENLHATFYRDILAAAAEAHPSATVEAVVAEILGFEMPGAGIRGFRRKAAEMALAGIYDLRIHRDQVVMPLVNKLRLFELTGLTPSAESARAELGTFLEEMDVSARKLEERRARAQARANR
jgi:acyl-[acyl-carrier-protein] desaturase